MIGTRLLHYLVTDTLGEGGMGIVYRARDLKLDREVALKVLSPATTTETGRRRFVEEARAASSLTHPNIVTIYEVNSHDGVDFIAMELVHGQTLRELAREARLPVPAVIEYGLQLADALGKAHKAGIVHRDLKPGNVMVSDGLVKILDFGIAKRHGLASGEIDDEVATIGPLTRPGMIVGTLGYLSPEQARGEAVDGRSDIFSLAAMLYELLSGVKAFTGTSTLAMLNSLANDEPPPLVSLRPDAAAVDPILRRGLAKHRDDRYASMEDLAADLRLALGGQTPSWAHSDVRRPAGPVRIPRYRNTFVGRETELAAIAAAFAKPAIVTLVAGGGTGKTRAAYEAALAMSDRFPDGLFAVELADGGAADVPIRTAEAVLGDAPLARTEGTTDPIGAVEKYLESRRALLVIDNCEHVVDAVRQLVSRLCRRCPTLSVLATSREVLGVGGEHVMPLAPLPQPSAVALFRDRAAAAGGQFDPDREQVAGVDAICDRLEGLPLAIELAASRVRTLRPAQIAARLGDALKLLRQRSGTGTERHRSLEAAIRWSYDLLDEAERTLLARMSVFVGGCDLAAVEAVGRDDVLDLVQSLADKSLVAVDQTGDAARYRLPEPIRQFAAERLDEIGATQTVRHAHFAHYLQLAQASVPQLDEAPRASLVAALSREHENFLAAIDRARTDGRLAEAAALSRTLHTYWVETGHVGVGTSVLRSILDASPHDPTMLPQLGTLVGFESMSGALEQADRRAAALRAILDRPIPDVVAGNVHFALGFVASARGRSAEAHALWSKAAAQLQADPFRARLAWTSAGQAATTAGCLDDAREAFRRAEALPPPVQGWFAPFVAFNRAVADVLDGRNGARALDGVTHGLDELERLGLRFRLLLATASGSLAFFRAGAIAPADAWWRRGLELGREMGHLWACWIMLEFAAWSAASRGNVRDAARLWGAVDAFAETRGYGHWELIRLERNARIDEVRARDPHAFTAAAAEGRGMPLSEMVDRALQRRVEGRAA